MQVSLTATGGLERRLEVAVPAQRVDSEVEERLKKLSRTARLKGFRPGKAPIQVIKKQFGEQVRAEVVGDLMRATLAEAITQEKLRPAVGPAHRAAGRGARRGSQVRRRVRGASRSEAPAAGRHCPSRSPPPRSPTPTWTR